MFQAIQKRFENDERGFTLIELMVVVLIIAILIAIAIPTFLGARERAQDRAAQSDLRNALLAAEVWYVDNENYNPTATNLTDIEPELAFDATIANADEDTIGFTGAADQIVFNRTSASGTVFCIAKTETGGTFYNSGTAAQVNTVALCNGASW